MKPELRGFNDLHVAAPGAGMSSSTTVGSAANSGADAGMKIFSYRAECQADVERFHQACALRGLTAVWTTHASTIGPDVEVDLQANASLEDLRQILRNQVDSHVMLQTLRECCLAANTLERDHTVR